MIWRKSILAGAVGLALGTWFSCILILRIGDRPPVVVHQIREVSDKVGRKGHIELFVELDRKQNCPSVTSQWLWTWIDFHGERIKQFYPLASDATGPSDPGHDQKYVLSIPVPPDIWPGEWFYWSKTVENCPFLPSLFRPSTRESGNLPIRILSDDQ